MAHPTSWFGFVEKGAWLPAKKHGLKCNNMSQNSKRINTWYKNIGKSEDEQKLSNGMSYCDKLGTFFSLPDIHRDVLKYCRHPDLYHGGPIVNYCHKIKVFDVWEVLLSAS